MVKFMRSVLQHLLAIVVAFTLFCVLGFILLLGFATVFQPKPVSLPSEAVLVVDLDIEIYDSPDNVDPLDAIIAEISGDPSLRYSLREVLAALEAAKEDDRIKGVLLTGTFSRGGSMANTLATLTELRAKLEEVRASGKKVFAYSQTDGIAELYLKSVADEHWMDPLGLFDYRGLAAQIAYLGAAFERLGIEYQVVRAGKFKSAAESYVEAEMSAETREALSSLLDDLWLDLREGIAAGTGLPAARLDALASENPLITGRVAASLELVDELLRFDEVIDELVEFAGYAPEAKTFRQIAFEDYVASRRDPLAALPVFARNQVVVVYAEGVIVDGAGDSETIGGDRFGRLLRELRKDDNVKAVVLRVNSPGGSATASEIIAREVELTNAVKPVVVSMGGYAASGGYYISAPAEMIFAQPTTVTGAIGVISMIPNVEALAKRFDVNFETVETNEHGTLWSLFESRSQEQLQFIDRRVEETYAAFLERVVQGRGLSLSEADAVAQGRDWSGVAALENRLVDRLGGLEDAIAHAADLAGIGNDFTLVDRPRPRTLEEVITEAFTGGTRASTAFDSTLGSLRRHAAPVADQLTFLRFLNDRFHLYSYAPVRLVLP
jgi:protease IV